MPLAASRHSVTESVEIRSFFTASARSKFTLKALDSGRSHRLSGTNGSLKG
ncbi:MAG: hypothetical protein H7Z11_11650 [Verrucomicrobia bacterium]|nr:hypothetical protein [Leptolyngbya sp. ES-bin-22]